MTLADRVMTTSNDTITNISVGRFDNITEQWGGSNSTFTGAPDWGRLLLEMASVYPDFVGPIGWAILFSLPFIMMWIAHADMTPAAVLGIFFGLYVFMFIPYQWQQVGILFIIIAIAAILWSLYQKRG